MQSTVLGYLPKAWPGNARQAEEEGITATRCVQLQLATLTASDSIEVPPGLISIADEVIE